MTQATAGGPLMRQSGPCRAQPGRRPRRRKLLTTMTYVIAEPCIDVIDESCVAVCPVDCIHFDQGVDRMLYIDPDECIDCGACEPECPVNAIFPEDSLPGEWAQFTELNARWFKDKDSARATIDEWKPPA
jgi:ferredoxin